jgi:hypothetical protein
MKKAYIDLTEFDVQRGDLQRAVERAVTHTDTNKCSAVVFLVRPSHVSQVENALSDRSNTSVVSVANATDVLAHIQTGRKKAAGFAPNDSTEYVYTFSPEVRNAVMGWRNQGWNVYFRRGTDFLSLTPAATGAVDADTVSTARSRNRKYEVAKHKAKKLHVYAEWRARKAIYSEIDSATNATEKLTLSDLKRVVTRRAREAAAKNGFDLQPNHFFAATDSVFRVALSCGVFRTAGGRCIDDKDIPYVVQVVGINADFRDHCDLFILESIINELGDVSDEHSLSLAHLMYGEGADEDHGGASLGALEEKFSNLMKLFGSRLGRTPAGFYKVAPVGGEKVQSIAAALSR